MECTIILLENMFGDIRLIQCTIIHTHTTHTHTHRETHTQTETHTHTHTHTLSSNSVASPTSVDPTADSNSNSSSPINVDSSPTIEPAAPIFEAGSTSVQANSPQPLD